MAFISQIDSLAIDTSLAYILVNEADYRQNLDLEAVGPRLERVVARVVLEDVTGVAGSTQVWLGLFLLDSDDPVPNLLATDNYINEQLLHFDVKTYNSTSAEPMVFELDVKPRRRLRSADKVVLVLLNPSTSASNFRATAVARTLLGGAF